MAENFIILAADYEVPLHARLQLQRPHRADPGKQCRKNPPAAARRKRKGQPRTCRTLPEGTGQLQSKSPAEPTAQDLYGLPTGGPVQLPAPCHHGIAPNPPNKKGPRKHRDPIF